MPSSKPDRAVKCLLAVVSVLLIANLWMMSGGTPRVARAAGIPDSGAQMQSMIEELKGVNTRLDALQKLIDSGNVTVKVKMPEEKERK